MLYTFDPKLMITVFKGHPITGFAEGSVLTIERTEDMFSEKVGVSGEVARSKSNNRSGTVKITLMQTSPDNDFLSTMAVLDEVGNAGVGELMIKDVLGTSLYMSSQAYLKKIASAEYGKEVNSREWNFFCADLNIFVGGNIPQL
jgi:hypothetical protein